jgi:hypothetical protein
MVRLLEVWPGLATARRQPCCVVLKARKFAGNQEGRRVSSQVDVLWGWRYFKYSEIIKKTISLLGSFARKREDKEKKSGWLWTGAQ